MERANRTRRFISFHGDGSGTYDLTWSQQQVCFWMEQAAPYFSQMNLGGLAHVDGATRVDDVAAALKLLIERHEALRTRIILDSSGVYRQAVHRSGKLPLDIRECATEKEAASILAEMRAVPFTEVEWPLRVAVLVSAGEVQWVALCLSHMASDGWGKDVLCRELVDLASPASDRRESVLRRPVIQPREQSDWERVNGESASRRVEKFWALHLKRFPNDRFPVSTGAAESPRFPEIMMESRAAAKAIEQISQRDRTTPNTVVIAALSILLGAISNTDLATFRLFCANRRSEASRFSAGNFYQVVPISVEVGNLSFREVATKTWQTTMRAYLLGPGHPDRLSVLEESMVHDLGVDPDLECFINLHAQKDSSGAVRDTSSEALNSTRIRKRGGVEVWESGKFYIDVWSVSEQLVISLWGDTAFFPSSVLSNLLSCLERLFLSVAADDGPGADGVLQEVRNLIDARMQDGLEYVDGCWVDLSEVRQMLVDCLSPCDVEVVLEGAEGAAQRRITAFLVLGGRSLTVKEVHRLVLDGIRGRRFVMTPHRYVICDRVPDLPRSAEAWTRQPVVSQGAGRR
ncbi:condensation domain-containing protein [Streptomyces sp. AC550_RSS872]|uniref:condensation domain-containing protein n=1 Tax=Streptomyces sp. AC550_RSS872 TaxID=2823689 RepID=UPI001C278258|nr:condensation domain-containing protein [Streptomyces sp. AC550_RSS872]